MAWIPGSPRALRASCSDEAAALLRRRSVVRILVGFGLPLVLAAGFLVVGGAGGSLGDPAAGDARR
jgi:hypothetical protein